MGKETELTIWEMLPTEHREALITSTQEAAKVFSELGEKISAVFSDLLDAVAQVFIDSLQPIIDKIIEEFDGIDVVSKQRKKWKPVKNTIPRYQCVQHKITPRARSCC